MAPPVGLDAKLAQWQTATKISPTHCKKPLTGHLKLQTKPAIAHCNKVGFFLIHERNHARPQQPKLPARVVTPYSSHSVGQKSHVDLERSFFHPF